MDARRSVSMIRALIPLSALLVVAACERQAVNPPTEPAAPIATSEVAPAAPSPPGIGPAMPGAGPATFVGRWAGDVDWWANTAGGGEPDKNTPAQWRDDLEAFPTATTDDTWL